MIDAFVEPTNKIDIDIILVIVTVNKIDSNVVRLNDLSRDDCWAGPDIFTTAKQVHSGKTEKQSLLLISIVMRHTINTMSPYI